MDRFEQRVREALVSPTTLIHAGSQVSVHSFSYGDAVHFLWDSAMRYSANVAEAATQALSERPTGDRPSRQ